MIFVKWLTEKSNYAYNEGGVSIAADDDKLPDLYSDFKNVKLIADEPAPDGEEDLFNDLNSDSELNINTGGDSRVQSIVEHAANKDEPTRPRQGVEPEVERALDSEASTPSDPERQA